MATWTEPLSLCEEISPGFTLKTIATEQFIPLWEPLAAEVFGKHQTFHFRQVLSDPEKTKLSSLGTLLGSPARINLAVFFKDKMVAWSFGFQESSDKFYVANSAILPEYRRRGFYKILIQKITEEACALGFQTIYSRHKASNNSVIIPKLKYGFLITGFEISDAFGLMIHLTYYPNKMRKKVIEYRTGHIKPDSQIRNLLDL